MGSHGSAGNKLVLTKIYHRMGDFPQALSWGKQAKINAMRIGDIKSQWIAEDYLADIYENQENYEAANRARKRAKILNDSLFATEKVKLAKEYEIRFEMEQKEMQINHLKKENQHTTLALQQQKKLRLALFVGLALLICSLILVYRISFFRLKANKMRLEKEQLIHQQNWKFCWDVKKWKP